jgi:hypothetical protein
MAQHPAENYAENGDTNFFAAATSRAKLLGRIIDTLFDIQGSSFVRSRVIRSTACADEGGIQGFLSGSSDFMEYFASGGSEQ